MLLSLALAWMFNTVMSDTYFSVQALIDRVQALENRNIVSVLLVTLCVWVRTTFTCVSIIMTLELT